MIVVIRLADSTDKMSATLGFVFIRPVLFVASFTSFSTWESDQALILFGKRKGLHGSTLRLAFRMVDP